MWLTSRCMAIKLLLLPSYLPLPSLSFILGWLAIMSRLRTMSFPALVPLGRSRKTVHAAPAPKTPPDAAIQELPRTTRVIPSLPELTSLTSRLPTWLHFSQKLRISRNLLKAGSSAPPCTPATAPASRAISTPTPVKLSTLTPSRSRATQALTDEFICGMVSKDNIRGRNRNQAYPSPAWSFCRVFHHLLTGHSSYS